MQFGKFRFLDLADGGGGRIGKGNRPFELLCPTNLIGLIDVMETPTHTIMPPLRAFAGAEPRIAVADNFTDKHDGDAEVLQGYRELPGFEGLWLLYPFHGGDAANPPSEYIANLDGESGGHYLKLSAAADGSFVMYNSRTNLTKSYTARHTN
jgi:hypothetical protein